MRAAGTYLASEELHAETECLPCPAGEWAGEVGAAKCDPCDKPTCAASVTTCNAKTGLEQTFTTHAPNTVVCVEPNADDPCDLPEYCHSDTATCDDDVNRRATMSVTLPGCAGDELNGVDCWGALRYTSTPLSIDVEARATHVCCSNASVRPVRRA